MSNLINKVKDALSSDDKSHSSSAPEGTHGHHNNRAANAADPRIDSDRDHRTAPGTTGGVGHQAGYAGGDNYAQGGSSGLTGNTGMTGATTGAGYGTGSTPNTAGPHGSNMMNKADPRVDSDMDGSRNMGANRGGMAGTTGATDTHPHHHAGATGTGMTGTGMTGTGMGGGNTAGYTEPGMGGTGNTAGYTEPGMGGGRGNTAGYTDTAGGMSGQHHGTHHAGAGTGAGMGSTGTGAAGYGSGPGPAPNTAGPHKSDMMNKVDPRVDSDLDNSKTVGGDKTYSAGNDGARDPLDASQVPPSVMRKHIGDPSIEHGDHTHDRARRNSSATHQEVHRGI